MSKLSYLQIEKITDFFKKFVQEENIKGNIVIEFDEFGNVEELDIFYTVDLEKEIDDLKKLKESEEFLKLSKEHYKNLIDKIKEVLEDE